MAGKKSVNRHLPSDIHVVRTKKRIYYYYAPRRGQSDAGKRISLGTDPNDKSFWDKYFSLVDEPVPTGDTLADLIQTYKASPQFNSNNLAERTKKNYLDAFKILAQFGGKTRLADIRRSDVLAIQSEFADRPARADSLIKVLGVLSKWALLNGWIDVDPTAGIKKLTRKENVDGAKPWPEWAFEYVLEHAPENIRRLAILGRFTGQREEDLIDMAPMHLERDGINVIVKKLRRKLHFVPLTRSQMSELRSWEGEPHESFLLTTKGTPFTTEALKAHWKRWKAEHTRQLQGAKLTIHGLRATKVCDMRLADGTPVDQVAIEICMSPGMVERYSSGLNRKLAAQKSRDRRESAEVVRINERKKVSA